MTGRELRKMEQDARNHEWAKGDLWGSLGAAGDVHAVCKAQKKIKRRADVLVDVGSGHRRETLRYQEPVFPTAGPAS